MNTNITMQDFLNMPHDQQVEAVELILMDLWDDGVVDLIGFDSTNQPIFRIKENHRHG
jgi:hypothetical protein